MLKRTLQAPSENGTIAGYTSDLSRFLRGGVPGERADEMVQEAHAHLLDRADAIAQAEDLSPAEAEAKAVASFTPAVQFAREMAQSAYETGHSQAWRTMGRTVADALFVGLMVLLVATDSFNSSITLNSPVTPFLFAVLLPLVGFCAYQSRRTQTRPFLIGGVLATVFTLLYTGFFYLDGAPTDENWTQGSRAGIKRAYTYFHEDQSRCTANLQQLQTGLQSFLSGNTVVPAELKGANGEGYLVPRPYLARRGGEPFALGTQETVPTLAQARTRWQTDGTRWLVQVERRKSVSLHYEEPLRIALQQTGFARTAPQYAAEVGMFSAYLVLCDGLFARLGRFMFAKRRTKRKQA